MATKPIDDSVIQGILADWRTGEYSQQKLADKHEVSKGAVNKLCKGVAQDIKSIVTAGIEYKQGLAAHGDRIVTAINDVVDKKIAQTKWLNKASMEVAEIALAALKADPTPQNAGITQKVMIDTHKAAGIAPYYPNALTTALQVNQNADRTLTVNFVG